MKHVLSLKPERLLIILMLACALFLSALAMMPEPIHIQVPSVSIYREPIDSIAREMGLSDTQIAQRTIRVDSSFARTAWTMDVPETFSKTTYHIRLDERLRELGLQTPASVDILGKSMQIHILYRHTVLETVTLRTRQTEPTALSP